jgi:hypothetical protein
VCNLNKYGLIDRRFSVVATKQTDAPTLSVIEIASVRVSGILLFAFWLRHVTGSVMLALCRGCFDRPSSVASRGLTQLRDEAASLEHELLVKDGRRLNGPLVVVLLVCRCAAQACKIEFRFQFKRLAHMSDD